MASHLSEVPNTEKIKIEATNYMYYTLIGAYLLPALFQGDIIDK